MSNNTIRLHVPLTTYRDENGQLHETLIYRLGQNRPTSRGQRAVDLEPDNLAVIVPAAKAYVVAVGCRDSAWFEEPLVPWTMLEDQPAGRDRVEQLISAAGRLELTLGLEDRDTTQLTFAFRVIKRQ